MTSFSPPSFSLIMAVAGFTLLSLPGSGQDKGPGPQGFHFDVFSIRPEDLPARLPTNTNPTSTGFRSRLTIWQAIMIAYGPGTDPATWASVEVLKAPDWTSDFYEIEARVAQNDLKAWQNQSRYHELLRSALGAALKERCRLAIHEEPVQADNFDLVAGKHGPKFKESAPNATLPNGQKLATGGVMEITAIQRIPARIFYGATMQDLADFLTDTSKKIPVRDKTGLTGRYDFTLLQIPTGPQEDRAYNFPVDRLGLSLRMGREMRPMLVIDHIEKPTAN